MKQIVFLFILLLFFSFSSCRKSKLNPNCWGDCEEATLFYKGRFCSSINGYIIFKDTTKNPWYVFKHTLPEEFRKDSIEVCISYRNKGFTAQTNDCLNGDEIKITCIQKK